LGVAAFDGHDQSLDQLLKIADTRVYTAKTIGRNRVCADDEPREKQTG
jgi:PleD family two-component response regulator